MVIKRTLKEPLKVHPNLCMELDDIEIIAEHYGYDFASCYVIGGFNNNQICMVGYCLVDERCEVVDDVEGWRHDMELIHKFYDHDLKYGFIEKGTTFEEYSLPYLSS